ncbi:KH domain-containing protein [Candidatus Woesebacteria bacterium]|nr:KH domain-containing protein [Candidatus Woesebacteria bacterium]
MNKLLNFLIAGITSSDKFEIEEAAEIDRVSLNVKADPSILGLIIGKQGATIRNIRKIMSVKATLENKLVNVSVTESSN